MALSNVDTRQLNLQRTEYNVWSIFFAILMIKNTSRIAHCKFNIRAKTKNKRMESIFRFSFEIKYMKILQYICFALCLSQVLT